MPYISQFKSKKIKIAVAEHSLIGADCGNHSLGWYSRFVAVIKFI